jgi:hypothetical protein
MSESWSPSERFLIVCCKHLDTSYTHHISSFEAVLCIQHNQLDKRRAGAEEICRRMYCVIISKSLVVTLHGHMQHYLQDSEALFSAGH